MATLVEIRPRGSRIVATLWLASLEMPRKDWKRLIEAKGKTPEAALRNLERNTAILCAMASDYHGETNRSSSNSKRKQASKSSRQLSLNLKPSSG